MRARFLFLTAALSMFIATHLFADCSWVPITSTTRMYTDDCTKVGVGTTTDPTDVLQVKGNNAYVRVDDTVASGRVTIYGADTLMSSTSSANTATNTGAAHRLDFGWSGFQVYTSPGTSVDSTRTWNPLMTILGTRTTHFAPENLNTLQLSSGNFTSKGRIQNASNLAFELSVNSEYNGSSFVLDNTSYPGWFMELNSGSDRIEFWRVPAGDYNHDDEELLLRLDNDGDLAVAGSVSAYGLDLAEWVDASADMPPGTVVILNRATTNEVMPSSKAYDTAVAGVVAEKPGVILGTAGVSKEMIATVGRVKVRVDATKGAIEVGDLLVTSGKPGTAMLSRPIDVGGVEIHRPGTIIGKALEPLTAGEGEILVLLSLQ